MQQNLNYVYPQIFWVDGCANTSTSCPPAPPIAPFPPPVPDRRRKPKSTRERSSIGFLVISLLILMALTGVGLSMFQIFHLEKQLAELREVKFGWLPAEAVGKSWWQQRVCLTSENREPRWAPHISALSPHLLRFWDDIQGFTGLYYVYSNVLFRGSICSSQMLSHVVYKTNPASPGSHVLMEDKYINYCANQKMWARKSYLGALFKLRERDSLYVNVSKISLVNFEESKTFFGLFKL
uniref:Fas ligand n=1 Tax=Anas platyrhynchos platyrhynchos TaxID=8840 RepID=U3ICC6_ANAPP